MPLPHAIRRPVMLLLIPLLLLGCSVKKYRSDLPNNFHINTVIHKSSTFRNTSLAVDVHLLNPDCGTRLLGRIYVDDPQTDAGVPVDRPIYLDFIFVSKYTLSSDLSVVRYQTVMTPHSGAHYNADVTYDKGIYSVVVREKRRSGAATVIARRSLESCRPGSAGGSGK